METRKARHHNPNQKDKKIMNNVVNALLARSRHPRCKTEPLNRHITDDLYNQSALAIGSYYTSHAMRQTQLLAIALDGKPILTLGYPDNDDTQREADTLLNLPSFARIAHEFFGAGELTKVVVKGDAVMGGNTPYSCIVFGEQGKTYEVDDNEPIAQVCCVIPLAISIETEAFAFFLCIHNDIMKTFVPEAKDIPQIEPIAA